MTNWTLAYDRFVPEEEGLREALTSTGNGYFWRGALAWAAADGVSYPGTYAHGGFNRETIMAGVPVLNEDLVNLPNWLLGAAHRREEAIDMSSVELLSYRHEYDIRNATVVRALRIRDRAGRETSFETRRFVSMADGAPGCHAVDHHARELVWQGGGDRRWTAGSRTGASPVTGSSKGGTWTRSPQGRSAPRLSPWRCGPASRASTSPRRHAPASTARKDRSTSIAASTRCRTTSTRCSPSR